MASSYLQKIQEICQCLGSPRHQQSTTDNNQSSYNNKRAPYSSDRFLPHTNKAYNQQEKQKKQTSQHTHTHLWGDDAVSARNVESTIPSTNLKAEDGWIVNGTTKPSMKKARPLLCTSQSRNATKKIKGEEKVQLNSSFVQTMAKGMTTKKRKLPPAKQWRQCKCGRLYRLNTGLCACVEAKALLKTSLGKETKRIKSEQPRSDDQPANHHKLTTGKELTLTTADTLMPQFTTPELPKTLSIQKEPTSDAIALPIPPSRLTRKSNDTMATTKIPLLRKIRTWNGESSTFPLIQRMSVAALMTAIPARWS